jgi:DNA repair protein RecO (recombination protein O)
MNWQDEAIIVSVQGFTERDLLICVLTKEKGRRSGLYSMSKRKSSPDGLLQVGDYVQVSWKGRLEQHLGRFSVEKIFSPTSLMLQCSWKLWIVLYVCYLMKLMPEGHPYEFLYHQLRKFLNELMSFTDLDAFCKLSFFEKDVLSELGFGIDISRCCVTQSQVDLRYISPKTARAVSLSAAGIYVDKLLILPTFWLTQNNINWQSVEEALRVTGYFLTKWLFLDNSAYLEVREYSIRYVIAEAEKEKLI